MESAAYLGVFGIRDKTVITSMPAHNNSGLWQAWLLMDGRVMVQPLDRSYLPWGSFFPMQLQHFGSMLMPVASLARLASAVPSDAAAPTADDLPYAESLPFLVLNEMPRSDASKARRLRSDAPDLLGVWYQEAMAAGIVSEGRSAPASESGEYDDYDDFLPPEISRELTHAPVSDDEPVLTPVWHPDEFFLDDVSDPAAPASPTKAVMPDLRHNPDGVALPPSIVFAEPVSPPSSPAAAEARAADEEPGSGDPEGRAARVERYLRTEFDALVAGFDHEHDADLDERVSGLLGKGTALTWKQKFMFTEFGLTLRRKRKPRLALKAHLRALELAPRDEHILFNVARTEFELGNTEAAKEYLARALESAPKFSMARNFLNFLLGLPAKA